jgi:hypothetical protein
MGEWFEAKVHLEQIMGDEFLAVEENDLIQMRMRQIDSHLDEQKKVLDELYTRALEYFYLGQMDMAQEHFDRMENVLATVAKTSRVEEKRQARMPAPKPTVLEDELLDAWSGDDALPEDEAASGSGRAAKASSRKPSRRTNLIRSHTQAVVKDALARARIHMDRDRFDRAETVVRGAIELVQKNKPFLSDERLRRYRVDLARAVKEIVAGKHRLASDN